jgi:hypothetical protein
MKIVLSTRYCNNRTCSIRFVLLRQAAKQPGVEFEFLWIQMDVEDKETSQHVSAVSRSAIA